MREGLKKKHPQKEIGRFYKLTNSDDPFSGKRLKFYQGDIILDSELEELIREKKKRKKRNATRQKKRLWTSRIIPYVVPSYMST